MVKLFVGKLPPEVRRDEVQPLFEQFGRVSECDLVKDYGFVHMEDVEAAQRAISHLNNYKLRGFSIIVAFSKSKIISSSKLHVANVSSHCSKQELSTLFEKYGPVVKCRIIKNDAFVEMERGEDAKEAMRALSDTDFKGKRIYVELSKSKGWKDPRTHCHKCGKEGHWSADCPKKRGDLEDGYSRDRSDPYSESLRPESRYGEQSVSGMDQFGFIDYYARYRTRPYGATVETDCDQQAPQHTHLSSPTSVLVHSGFEYQHVTPQNAQYSQERSPLQRPRQLFPPSSRDSLECPHLAQFPTSSRSFYEQASSANDTCADSVY
ncbi:RNA-binding protein 4-like [Carcharodon carcharias]|uniref:RNA-binding protein 4-like n=1 Tax=Carcharodon carcharias TaxID=13397 RepID=UPI001B7E793C|nr:RNA-binding protein 4-like [Carcharodon carcharias]